MPTWKLILCGLVIISCRTPKESSTMKSDKGGENDFREDFFYGKAYYDAGFRLELFKNRARGEDNKGFFICKVESYREQPSLQKQAECVWEYSARDNALIVWIDGNRDWWDVKESGEILRDGDDMLVLEGGNVAPIIQRGYKCGAKPRPNQLAAKCADGLRCLKQSRSFPTGICQ